MCTSSNIPIAFVLIDLNDLWSFNITSQQWTWHTGSNGTAQRSGWYGPIGVAQDAERYYPGPRQLVGFGVDSFGHPWVFSGDSSCLFLAHFLRFLSLYLLFLLLVVFLIINEKI